MRMKKILTRIAFISLIASFFFILAPNEAWTQACNIGGFCMDDSDCHPGSDCPACVICDNDTCVVSDAFCDDGSDCTSDSCNVNPVPMAPDNGCLNTPLVLASLPPDPNLDIECYICEPTANGVTVDNGVCDRAAGEACPDPDCQVPGETCGPPPVIPQGDCDMAESFILCQDGDRCTINFCAMPAPDPNNACQTIERTCNQNFADGCCPEGCNGPDPSSTQPNPCLDPAGAPIPDCDLDCWFPQVCGDGLVQPPETCDDTADQGDAGISPLGQVVSNEQCRNQGAVAECTYCGDGILQAAAGEECELGQTGTCGTGECNLSTCECEQEQDICITGSGNPWDTIRVACGNCSLNRGAISQGWMKDYRIFFILIGLLAVGLFWRKRSAS